MSKCQYFRLDDGNEMKYNLMYKFMFLIGSNIVRLDTHSRYWRLHPIYIVDTISMA